MHTKSALQTLLSSFEKVAVSLVIKQLIQLLARADMTWLSHAQAASTPEVSSHYYDAVRDLTLYRNHIELRFAENLHREFSQLNTRVLNSSPDKKPNASALPGSLALEGISSADLASTYATLCTRLTSLGMPASYLDNFPLHPAALERLFTEIIGTVAIEPMVKKTVTETFADGLVRHLHRTYQQLTAVLDAIPQTAQTRSRPTAATPLRLQANGSTDQAAVTPQPSSPKKIKGPSASPEWIGIESDLTLEEYEQRLRILALKSAASPKSHSDVLARPLRKEASARTESPCEPVDPYIELLHTLEPGDWIEVVRADKWMRMRLSWISKKTASYFFVDERRGQFLQKTETALLLGLKNQEITLVGKTSTFDRPSPTTPPGKALCPLNVIPPASLPSSEFD